MKPFKVKTKTGAEKWYWVDGSTLIEVAESEVPGLIEQENTAKLERALERIELRILSISRQGQAWPA
jgi:hypothetical protein